MALTVYSSTGNALFSDARVNFVFKKNAILEALRRSFPNLFQDRADGSVVLAAFPSSSDVSAAIDRVEIESQRLNLALIVVAGVVLVLGYLALFRK